MHRFNFNTHLQQTSQSITKCLAKLWHFSEFCKFRETLNDMLQHCLVYGVEDAIRQLPLVDTVELSVQEGCLLWDSRVIVPRLVCDKVMEETHPIISKMKNYTQQYVQ